MFLPKNYKEPVTTNYMKFVDGDNTFRILSSAIVGYIYWKTTKDDNGKEIRVPVRKHLEEKIPMEDLETKEDGTLDMPKVFWAMVVYNYDASRIQILEITQVSVRKKIQSLVENKSWGDPIKYDLCVVKEGQGLQTDYETNPIPPEPFDKKIIEQYKAMKINLDVLYEGKDPFKTNGDSKSTPIGQVEPPKEVTDKDIEEMNIPEKE